MSTHSSTADTSGALQLLPPHSIHCLSEQKAKARLFLLLHLPPELPEPLVPLATLLPPPSTPRGRAHHLPQLLLGSPPHTTAFTSGTHQQGAQLAREVVECSFQAAAPETGERGKAGMGPSATDGIQVQLPGGSSDTGTRT